MPRIKKISLVVVSAAIAVVLLATLSNKPSAPDISYSTLKGEKLTTADLYGKVVLVNFWATSCTTCVGEMPKIVETYNKYSSHGLEVIAVAMNYDPPNYVLNYAQSNNLPFKVALDPQGEIALAFGAVRVTPTTLIVDKKGAVVQQIIGEPDFAKLQLLLEKLLSQPS
jgi:peroxiredoxin